MERLDEIKNGGGYELRFTRLRCYIGSVFVTGLLNDDMLLLDEFKDRRSANDCVVFAPIKHEIFSSLFVVKRAFGIQSILLFHFFGFYFD